MELEQRQFEVESVWLTKPECAGTELLHGTGLFDDADEGAAAGGVVCGGADSREFRGGVGLERVGVSTEQRATGERGG
jgi:hypothetical protein